MTEALEICCKQILNYKIILLLILYQYKIYTCNIIHVIFYIIYIMLFVMYCILYIPIIMMY